MRIKKQNFIPIFGKILFIFSLRIVFIYNKYNMIYQIIYTYTLLKDKLYFLTIPIQNNNAYILGHAGTITSYLLDRPLLSPGYFISLQILFSRQY